jgi:predicted enzyme related to lactoylglutathione lyase
MTQRESVTGIGGVFFKARDHKALASWYREHLGVPVAADGTYGMFSAGDDGRDATGTSLQTVWSTFASDTKYFGPGGSGAMINYRVKNLDAMLAQLRAAGVEVIDKVSDEGFGRFGWGVDPEGNRFELWEPPSDGE